MHMGEYVRLELVFAFILIYIQMASEDDGDFDGMEEQ